MPEPSRTGTFTTVSTANGSTFISFLTSMLEPYWISSDQRHQIVNADCAKHLSQKIPVDITVTSPIYNQLGSRVPFKPPGMNKNSPWMRYVKERGYDDDMSEGVYQKWLRALIRMCLRTTRGLVWVNHKIRYRAKSGIHPLHFLDFPFYSEIIWERQLAYACNAKKFVPKHEVIYGFGVPHYWDRQNDMCGSVWRMESNHKADKHTCAFPIELPRRLIIASCPVDGIVYDPFAGSCTTGVAAINEGRRFIGVELSEDTCKEGVRRLKHALTSPRSLFMPEKGRRRLKPLV